MSIGKRLSIATVVVAVAGLACGALSLVSFAVGSLSIVLFVFTILCAVVANCIGNLSHYINRRHNMTILRTTRFGRALAFALLVLTMLSVVMLMYAHAFYDASLTAETSADREQVDAVFTYLTIGLVVLFVFVLSWFPGKLAVAIFRTKLDAIADREAKTAAEEQQRFVEEKQRADAAQNRREREEAEERRRQQEKALEHWQNTHNQNHH